MIGHVVGDELPKQKKVTFSPVVEYIDDSCFAVQLTDDDDEDGLATERGNEDESANIAENIATRQEIETDQREDKPEEFKGLVLMPTGRSLSSTDLHIVNRLLKTEPMEWDSTYIPVWAPPPTTPEEDGGALIKVSEDARVNDASLVPHIHTVYTITSHPEQFEGWIKSEGPTTLPMYDDQGCTNPAIDGIDFAEIVFDSIQIDKSWREDLGSLEYAEKFPGHSTLALLERASESETPVPVMMANEDMAPNPLTQRSHGRPEVKRRPQQRQMSRESQTIINSWFETTGITIGNMADTPERVAKARRLCYTWKDVFVMTIVDITVTDMVKHSIVTDPNVKPFRLRQPKYTLHERSFAQKFMHELEKADLVIPGIAEWAAHTRWPVKKDGNLRMVANYQPVNSATIKPQWPTHSREGVFNTIVQGDFKVMSCCDAAHGFWAVEIEAEDRHKASFITPNGQWIPLRMTQGLTGSPHTYAAWGDIGFGQWEPPEGQQGPSYPPLLGYHREWHTAFDVFVDDHTITAKTFEDMFDFLHHHYFPRLKFMKIGLSPKKSMFFADSVISLGFEISGGVIRPNQKHRERFKNWAKTENHPTSVKELEEFLYLTPYLKSYIPGRADLENILRDAYQEKVATKTPKGRPSVQKRIVQKPFSWGPAQAEAFVRICEAVQREAMKGANPEWQYHLAVDASGRGIGGILFQLEDQAVSTTISDRLMPAMRIICFYSYSLKDAETRYTTGEREALAIIRFLRESERYILPSPFSTIVYTDHHNLLKIFGRESDNKGRLAGWLDNIGRYDFVVEHRANTSKAIRIADGLSRITGPISSQYDKEELHEPLPFTVTNHTWMVKNADDRWKNCSTLPLYPFSASASLQSSPGSEDRVKMMAHRDYHKDTWYMEIFAFILYGADTLKGFSKNRQRLIKKRSWNYRVANGVLYYVEITGEWSYCITHKDVPEALKFAHEIHGHYGDTVTLRNLHGRFWWPSRYPDVVTYCKTCRICAQVGPRRPDAVGSLRVVPLGMWMLVGMDFIGPISPPGPHGEKYILVAIDYFSRFGTGVAAENTGSQGIINWWEQTLEPIFGIPEKAYADNATGFKATQLIQYFESHGSELTHGPVYAPWAHGLIERFVQLLVGQLRKWAAEVGYEGLHRWAKQIGPRIRKINNRKTMSEGKMSPSEIMLGWSSIRPPRLGSQSEDQLQYTEPGLGEMLMADDRRTAMRTQMAEYYIDRDESKPEVGRHEYRIGEWVWERVEELPHVGTVRSRGQQDRHRKSEGGEDDAQISKKFTPKWKGPYEIVRIVSDVSVAAVDAYNKRKIPRRLHVNNIKPYLQREPEYVAETGKRGPTTITEEDALWAAPTPLVEDYPGRELGRALDLRPRIKEPRGKDPPERRM